MTVRTHIKAGTRDMNPDKAKKILRDMAERYPLGSSSKYSCDDFEEAVRLSIAALDVDPDELDRAYARAEAAEAELSRTRAQLEKLRKKAWWKTYNAVLPSRCIYQRPGREPHEDASYAADLAHGPLDRSK